MQERSVIPGRARLYDPGVLNESVAKYIEIYAKSIYGLKNCKINPVLGTILIEYDPQKISLDVIKSNLQKAIESALNMSEEQIKEKTELYKEYFNLAQQKKKTGKKFLIYSAIYILFKLKQSKYGKFALSKNVTLLQIASAATIIGGYPLVKSLYKKLTKQVPADSDILLKLTALSLTIIRESAKGVLVLALKELNDYLKYAADVSIHDIITKKITNPPGTAWVKNNNEFQLMSINELKPGDIIKVNTGEIIPVDGKVIDGKAVTNSIYYNGQMVIENIEKGRKVAHGLSILSGELEIKVTNIPDFEPKLDISIEKFPLHKRVHQFQKWITPVAFSAATASYLFTRDIMRSLSIMLVLTPSAVGVAESSGIKNYVALLNKNKIYLKNPNTLNNIIDAKQIVFDKTGTLTYGKMQIRDIKLFDNTLTKEKLLNICAACEVENYHPISLTIRDLKNEKIDFSKLQSSVYLPARGVKAQYDGHDIIIGNSELLTDNSIDINEALNIYRDLQKQALTPILVSIDNKLAGMIVLEDKLREQVPEAITKLRKLKISDISLLTGDSKTNADFIASKLNIPNVYANKNAEQKAQLIQHKKQQGKVIMVGDGINDIPAMQAADLSISFISPAADKVFLNSDCLIDENNIAGLADYIMLSQKTYRIINQSITFAQIYNIFYGIWAIFFGLDAFTAKTLNTANSLYVLLLNNRINFLKSNI